MKNNLPHVALALTLSICFLLPQPCHGQEAPTSPTGPAGDYHGVITTGGSIDPQTGNAKRVINDMTIAGSVGAYPLNWTRTLNTRGDVPGTSWWGGFGTDGSWSHSYDWKFQALGGENATYIVNYPDGRKVSYNGGYGAAGYEPLDRIVAGTVLGDVDLLLRDGGKVHFRRTAWYNEDFPLTGTLYAYFAHEIEDPYGNITTLTYDFYGRLETVTEPAGRNLYVRYQRYHYWPNPNTFSHFDIITSVDAFDRPGATVPTQTVIYDYDLSILPDRGYARLRHANYSDGTHATYTYRLPNVGAGAWLVETCDDVRYAGPMKKIRYDYLPFSGTHPDVGPGQVKAEKTIDGTQTLTEIVYPPDEGLTREPWAQRKEKRPNQTSRLFQYGYYGDMQGLPWSYTDFQGYPTSYAQHQDDGSAAYTETFTDARFNSTTTDHEGVIGAITKLTHPPSVEHPEGSTVEYHYSSDADPYFLDWKIDERGNKTWYDRDEHNRIGRIRYPDGGEEIFAFDKNPFGLVDKHTMTSGGIEVFEYDDRGLKTTFKAPSTSSDPNPSPTQYFYYGGPPGPAESGNEPSMVRPDLTDRLRRVIDPRGNNTWYEYNIRGQITRIKHDDGTSTQNRYNIDGTLEWTTDELGHTTTYVYDDYKRVTEVKNHLQQIVTNSYDPGNGLPLSHTTSSVYRVTSHMQKHTDYHYDANFRRDWTKQPLETGGDATTEYHYDAAGNLEWVKDPRLNKTTYGYDERNRQTSISILVNGVDETTSVEYDTVGNKTTETRPDGAVRKWQYDAMNRLWRAYDWRMTSLNAVGEVTIYDRDFAGNVRTITDGKGSVYTYFYDAMNRKTGMTYPDDAYSVARSEIWRYDPAGNLKFYCNPSGKYRHFVYDDRNRQRLSYWNLSPTEQTPPVPDLSIGQKVATDYDAASRVTSIVTNNGETTIEFAYDAANRKIWEDQTLIGHPTQRVQTDLDNDGNRQNLQIISDPEPGVLAVLFLQKEQSGSPYFVHYDYTARNQVKSIYGEDWAFNYFYDPSGNMVTREALYNGVSSSTHCPNYDALNRPTIWEQTGPAGPNYFHTVSHYQYDRANREEATWRDEDNGRGERFSYDPTNQLAGVAYNAQNVSTGNPQNATRTVGYAYTLDRLNRSTVTDSGVNGGQATHYAQSPLNQYGSVGGVNFSYDSNFNLTAAGALSVAYDAASHVVSATHHDYNFGDISVNFVYDGLGRCVKRTVGGYAAVFAYDGWKPIGQWDEWKFAQGWNVYGPGADEILLRYHDVYGYIRFQSDPHGNGALLLDNNGHILEKYAYDAFGTPTVKDGDGGYSQRSWSYYGHRFQYQGREYLHEFGIYDYRNRFYSPELGRFVQADPKGLDAGDMNLFRYCSDDPMNKSDPFGLEFYDLGYERVSFVAGANMGITQPSFSFPIVLTRVPGGYIASVEKFDLSVHSLVGKLGKEDTHSFVRSEDNVQRTIKHEGNHRNNNKGWYDKNEKNVLAALRSENKNKIYKDPKEAKAAIERAIQRSYEQFRKQEDSHTGPNWRDYKQPDNEHP
jgi:RHS repeat-associated protein